MILDCMGARRYRLEPPIFFFFDTVLSVMNMRYFESQQIVLEDGDEECEINRTLL
jgi:hypothetical protein